MKNVHYVCGIKITTYNDLEDCVAFTHTARWNVFVVFSSCIHTYINDICESLWCVCVNRGADVWHVYIWSCVWHGLFLGLAEINDLNELPEKQLTQSF